MLRTNNIAKRIVMALSFLDRERDVLYSRDFFSLPFPPIKGRHNRKHKKKLHLPLVKIAN